MSRFHVKGFRILPVAAALAVTACSAPSSNKPKMNPSSTHASVPGAVDTPAATPTGGSAAAPAQPVKPAETRGSAVNVHARTGVLPLGLLPFDDLSLPLISPDGRFAATQTGAPPDWSALEAAPDPEIPFATHVEIHEIDYTERTVGLRHTLPDQVLLGRGGDMQGFLVELPRADGSRWIGYCGWTTGEITWLVDDANTNAFATLGPRGQLAWSRRGIDREHFELVVRGADGNEWSIPDGGSDWVFPSWSGTENGLFVVRLRNDRIELAHATASDPVTLLQSLRAIPVPGRATVSTAYQMMNGQPVMVGAALAQREQIVFFHPTQRRAALWRPRSLRDVFAFTQRSFTAIMEDGDVGMAATDRDLWRQSVLNERQKGSLLRGLLIPRRTARTDWPFILLTPKEGKIGLTAMTLVE